MFNREITFDFILCFEEYFSSDFWIKKRAAELIIIRRKHKGGSKAQKHKGPKA